MLVGWVNSADSCLCAELRYRVKKAAFGAGIGEGLLDGFGGGRLGLMDRSEVGLQVGLGGDDVGGAQAGLPTACFAHAGGAQVMDGAAAQIHPNNISLF